MPTKPETATSRPPGLERERVVHAAITLLDEVGYDRLTLRRVAEKLHVKAAALYWHFKNKQDLIDAMAQYLLRERHEQRKELHLPHMPWQDILRRVGQVQRRALLAHRDGARLMASANLARMPLMDGIERILHTLKSQGFPPDLALLSIINISRYTLGCVFEEQADPLSKEEALSLRKQMLAESADRFPVASEAMQVFARKKSLGPEGQYEHGLELLIIGIEHKLKHTKA